MALAYLGLGWGLLETAEFTLGILETPDWVYRACIAAVGLGFPIVLTLSWVFDIQDGKIVRTDSVGSGFRTWVKAAVSAPVVVGVVASSWWVWTGYVQEKERSLRPTDLAGEVPIVAVLPIRNLTGNPELDWFGAGIVNLVTDNLSNSRYLRIASPQRIRTILTSTQDPTEIAGLALEQDIGFIMEGEMLATPDGIYVTTRLTDTAGGVVLSANQVEKLDKLTILKAAGPIAKQIKKGLGVPREEQIETYVADFAIDNQKAYEKYVEGLRNFVDFKIEEAGMSFQQALELAPDYGAARYRLAYIQAVSGKMEQAEQSARKALEDPFLLDRERRYVEAFIAYVTYQQALATQLLEAFLEDYPYELEARELLARVYRDQYRLEEASEQLKILVSESPRNLETLAYLGSVYSEMGEKENAFKAYQRLTEIAPDHPNGYFMLGNWYLQAGNFIQAQQQYDIASSINPSMPGLKYKMATLLYLNNQSAEAVSLFEAVARDDTNSISERIDAMFDWAALVSAAGLTIDAINIIESFTPELKSEQVRYPMSLSRRGLLYSDLGEYEQASQLIEQAIESTRSVPTRHLFARARLEIARGQYDNALLTAGEIETFALPPENPDRTEEAAAAFIRGKVAFAQKQMDAAGEWLREANATEGYWYALYGLPLADLLLEIGEIKDARALLELAQMRTFTEPFADPRIDLEKERVEAAAKLSQLNAMNSN
ncbi:MAG: hypothetical protein RLZZ602_1378 [Pseudomonadota bacterium]